MSGLESDKVPRRHADGPFMSLRGSAIHLLFAAAALGACAPGTEGTVDRSKGAQTLPARSPGSSGELTPAPAAGAPSPVDTATPQPSPGPVGASECPNQKAVVADGQKRAPGRLRGDLDGDGRAETVWLAIDDGAEAGCQVFLTVASGPQLRSVPIVQPELNLALAPPSVIGMARVDPEPGLEVVVDLVIGASTRFVGLFGMQGEDLTRIGFDGPGTLPRDLFAYGGSVAHIDGVDCARPLGTVVVTNATPRAERYTVVRRYYRMSHGGSTLLSQRTERRVVPPKALNRFSELASPPFAGCL